MKADEAGDSETERVRGRGRKEKGFGDGGREEGGKMTGERGELGRTGEGNCKKLGVWEGR